MENDTLTLEAYQQALALLRRCLTPSGFVAAAIDVDNYARIWARDGVIASLAGLASGETDLIDGMKHTLDTLAAYQGPHGEIPSNITVAGDQVSYGQLVGRVDALLWYVIGVCAYLDYTKHNSRVVQYWLSIEKALSLAACWEFNARGFIYTPISGNWADEYIQQGYVLSDQILYLTALKSAGRIFDNKEWLRKAAQLASMIEVNYWPRAALVDDSLVYHTHAYRYQLEHAETIHWLPTFSPVGYTRYFDGLAHALVLLAGIGDEEQRQLNLAYTLQLEQQIASPLLPAFWPVIKPGDPEWSLLEHNALYGQLKNQPYSYHNGLYVLGLAHSGNFERAQQLLVAINNANEQESAEQQWAFAEYHHGQTHAAMGTTSMAWSAAATILAHQAVQHHIVPWPL